MSAPRIRFREASRAATDRHISRMGHRTSPNGVRAELAIVCQIPWADVWQRSSRRASPSIAEVRGDDPELASNLRIEERELEAGGHDKPTITFTDTDLLFATIPGAVTANPTPTRWIRGA